MTQATANKPQTKLNQLEKQYLQLECQWQIAIGEGLFNKAASIELLAMAIEREAAIILSLF